ncbi:hypothetical protein BLNAU_15168 [Blattamonas nauphoetae]|uniref:Uncharacterized protein n=1 Tax=Blattamonas nauphoetae TaxID=2049346 RepID=A0ABQ9XEP1_9EUKA|nr:hypothetical protein BLNAU_15168 [Blattamonas nauphoetae]
MPSHRPWSLPHIHFVKITLLKPNRNRQVLSRLIHTCALLFVVHPKSITGTEQCLTLNYVPLPVTIVTHLLPFHPFSPCLLSGSTQTLATAGKGNRDPSPLYSPPTVSLPTHIPFMPSISVNLVNFSSSSIDASPASALPPSSITSSPITLLDEYPSLSSFRRRPAPLRQQTPVYDASLVPSAPPHQPRRHPPLAFLRASTRHFHVPHVTRTELSAVAVHPPTILVLGDVLTVLLLPQHVALSQLQPAHQTHQWVGHKLRQRERQSSVHALWVLRDLIDSCTTLVSFSAQETKRRIALKLRLLAKDFQAKTKISPRTTTENIDAIPESPSEQT